MTTSYVLGYSGSGGPASSHAAEAGPLLPGGFARAACRRDLFLLVDHVDGVPVRALADAHEATQADRASGLVQVVGCNRCRAKLAKV